jgi:hypothetical protein
MYRPVLLLSLVALLSACADTPDFSRTLGRLELRQPLAIPSEAATLRFQGGRAVAYNQVAHYLPFCVFELNTVSGTEQPVQPDRFRITAMAHSIDVIAAVAGPGWRRAGFDDNGPVHLYYKTWFRLRSEQQTTVRALTCMRDEMMASHFPLMRHLTLAEMREALGSGFQLGLPADDGRI